MMIGYFGRANENGHSARHTKTHVINDRKVLCGYKPHKTMMFQWCSNGLGFPSTIECVSCKEKAKKILEKEYSKKTSALANNSAIEAAKNYILKNIYILFVFLLELCVYSLFLALNLII
jgi:hypothetical protein